jgi:integral membrane sensor domain MASE1
MKKSANLNNNLKRFLFVALGGLLGTVLYGIGKYLITGHTDIEHLITFFIIWLIGGAIGFLIAIKMFDL